MYEIKWFLIPASAARVDQEWLVGNDFDLVESLTGGFHYDAAEE
jgi:hypothetical protein